MYARASNDSGDGGHIDMLILGGEDFSTPSRRDPHGDLAARRKGVHINQYTLINQRISKLFTQRAQCQPCL